MKTRDYGIVEKNKDVGGAHAFLTEQIEIVAWIKECNHLFGERPSFPTVNDDAKLLEDRLLQHITDASEVFRLVLKRSKMHLNSLLCLAAVSLI